MNENDKIVEIKNSNNINVDVCEQIPTMPTDPQYAYAYVRFQNATDLYGPQNALEYGTVFAQLNMPYCGWNSRIVK